MLFSCKFLDEDIRAHAEWEERATPDVEAFVRRTDNLPGPLAVHFEEEAEVLLALIDKGMSPEQFKRVIVDKLEPHG